MQPVQEVYVGPDAHGETIYGTAFTRQGEVICSY